MPISNSGWELHIARTAEQKRMPSGRRRTVGKYQIFHDGVAQTGRFMKGASAESKGPGKNRPAENGHRVEAGTYPLATQGGAKYVTIGYKDSKSETAKPKPGVELTRTGQRTEILFHPGRGFLSSIGCINFTTALANAAANMDYVESRERVIAVIEDLKAFLGSDFPRSNGKKIPRAFVVIDGEP